MFVGSLGTVKGLDAPNTTLDSYLSTRTSQGWVTTLPGLTGTEALTDGRHDCSRDMSLCLDHKGQDIFTNEGEENAPYEFRANGEDRRLPTNVNAVPEGGTNFHGDQRMSGDFSKFVFSSTNVPFTEEGIVGSPGSAYINDIKARTVKVISKLAHEAYIDGSTSYLKPKVKATFGIIFFSFGIFVCGNRENLVLSPTTPAEKAVSIVTGRISPLQRNSRNLHAVVSHHDVEISISVDFLLYIFSQSP